jgi:F1F0 ATPase subunit 2
VTDDWSLVVGLALALCLGAIFGALYFRLLWRGTQRLVVGRDGPARLFLGFALRLVLALGVLALAIRAGAAPGHLLAGALGFTLARQVTLRRTIGRE